MSSQINIVANQPVRQRNEFGGESHRLTLQCVQYIEPFWACSETTQCAQNGKTFAKLVLPLMYLAAFCCVIKEKFKQIESARQDFSYLLLHFAPHSN